MMIELQKLLLLLHQIQNFLSSHFSSNSYYYELEQKFEQYITVINAKPQLKIIAASEWIDKLEQLHFRLNLQKNYQIQSINPSKITSRSVSLLNNGQIASLSEQKQLTINASYPNLIESNRKNLSKWSSKYDLKIHSLINFKQLNSSNMLAAIYNLTTKKHFDLSQTVYLTVERSPQEEWQSQSLKKAIDNSLAYSDLKLVILFSSATFELSLRCRAEHQRFEHNFNRLTLPFPDTEQSSKLYLQLLKQVYTHLGFRTIITSQIVNDIECFFENRIYGYSTHTLNTKNLLSSDYISFNLIKTKTINHLQQKLQQNLKSIKQLVSSAKEDLLNPFLSYSLSYQIQSLIQSFQTRIYQANRRHYIVLINAETNDNIHQQLLNLINSVLSNWLEEQNHIVYQISKEHFEQYQKIKLDLNQIDFNSKLFPTPVLLSLPRLELNSLYEETILADLNMLDCGKVNKNKLVYRFILVMFISLVLYFSTGLILGLMPLLIQGLNLILTRETQQLKLEQKAEILRKNLEQKYQHLTRLAVNQAYKKIVAAVELQHQQYEHNLEQLKQELNQQLQTAKQIKQEQSQYLKAYDIIKYRYLSKITSL